MIVGGCDILYSSSKLFQLSLLLLSSSSKSSRSGWRNNERRVSEAADGDFKFLPPVVSRKLVLCDSPITSSVDEDAGNLR